VYGSKICFISVGSGLNKLTQLKQLDEQLLFKYNSADAQEKSTQREEQNEISKHDSTDDGLFYFLPIAFLFPWFVIFIFGIIHGEWLIGTVFSSFPLGFWAYG